MKGARFLWGVGGGSSRGGSPPANAIHMVLGAWAGVERLVEVETVSVIVQYVCAVTV